MSSKTDTTQLYLGIDAEVAPGVPSGTKNLEVQRRSVGRTPSMAIQAEKEDLKEAAEQSSTVILDLNLDGKVRWVSPSWEDIIG